jgi:hypothetical protein
VVVAVAVMGLIILDQIQLPGYLLIHGYNLHLGLLIRAVAVVVAGGAVELKELKMVVQELLLFASFPL